MRARFLLSLVLAGALAGCFVFVDTGGLSGDADAAAPADASPANDASAGNGHSGELVVDSERVLNRYAAVVAAAPLGATTIEVDRPSELTPGDAVLVVQVAGLTSATSGDTTPVDLKTSSVGRYEIARVKTVSGTSVALESPLSATYAANVSQLVTVPEYTKLVLRETGKIRGQPWDGARGGVVALFVQDALVNVGTISADALGFRGGAIFRTDHLNDCAALDGTPRLGYAAKGEGLFPVAAAADAGDARGGRGNLANGGGGGNCHNAGGGGGGNGGAGGRGGRTCCGAEGTDTGGLGGSAVVAPVAERLVFGGGGGAGDAEKGEEESSVPGGRGGGIVLVRTRSLEGSGTITASGEHPQDGDMNGSPGGGAGGTILIEASASVACTVVRAAGGGGGNLSFPTGTGGGGGGGRVRLRASTSSCVADVRGGAAGAFVAAGGARDTRGSAPGDDGRVETAAP